jgi:hypothetical protein
VRVRDCCAVVTHTLPVADACLVFPTLLQEKGWIPFFFDWNEHGFHTVRLGYPIQHPFPSTHPIRTEGAGLAFGLTRRNHDQLGTAACPARWRSAEDPIDDRQLMVGFVGRDETAHLAHPPITRRPISHGHGTPRREWDRGNSPIAPSPSHQETLGINRRPVRPQHMGGG